MKDTTIAESCTLHARIGWQGLTKSEYLDEGDYYLVTGVDFDHGRIDFANCHYVTKDRYDQDLHIQLKVDDVLVTKDGTIGKVAIIDKPIDKPATLNSGVFVVRPKNTEALLPQYLMIVLLSDHFNRFIEQIKVGCTIAHLNQEKFLNFRFPLPTINEQKHIITLFASMSAIIKHRYQQIASLDQLIKARFIEMFGDCSDRKRLEEFAVLITKGASPKWQGVDYCDEGTLFVTSENVREGYVDLSKRKYLPNRINSILPRSVLQRNDVLINIVGASIGRAAIFESDELANINQAVAIVRIQKNMLDLRFLITYLNSEEAQRAYSFMKKGGARDNLSLQNISDLLIPVATINAQKQFAFFITQVNKSKSIIQAALDMAQLLFDSLMQQYFG